MQPRISLITLGVRDLQRSLRFYRDGLGLPTTWNGDQGVVFFQTQGAALALYPLASLAHDLGRATPPEAASQLGITLAHNVHEREEVDQLLAQAEAAGAKIEQPPHNTAWGGYAGYFSDPDGHLWEIAHGAFPFRADGSLEIP